MTRGSRRVTVLLALLAVIAAGCGQKNGVHVASSGSSGTGAATAASGEGAAAGAATGTDTGTAGATDTGTAAAAGAATSGGTTAATTKSGAKAATATGGTSTGAGAAAGGAAASTSGVSDTEIRIGIHAPVTGAAPFPATSFNDGTAVYFNFLNDTSGTSRPKGPVLVAAAAYP